MTRTVTHGYTLTGGPEPLDAELIIAYGWTDDIDIESAVLTVNGVEVPHDLTEEQLCAIVLECECAESEAYA